MPITHPASLRPGTAVSIVLKADQRTGRQVQGTVAQLLTRHNHPRGVKVKLTDGRVGRVQRIFSSSSTTTPNQSQSLLNTNINMSHSNNPYSGSGSGGNTNPWAGEQSHGNPFSNSGQEQQQQQQQQQQGVGAAANYYQQQPQPHSSQPQHHQQPPQRQHHHRPGPNDDPLANDPNRGEQFERMQAYEASAPQSEDDRNQAQLQKEFPNIDGSLIAAIYNERGGAGLAEVREMLQELNQGQQ